MQQTFQMSDPLDDEWKNWKEFIILNVIFFSVEIIGMIVITVYHKYVFGDHFAKLDKYHKVAELDIFIGTMIWIVTNIILLYVNYYSIIQPRDFRKLKMWMMYHAFGLFIFIIILINFQVVLRCMGVFDKYSQSLVTVVSWSYSMTLTLGLVILFVYYMSYKPIQSSYRRNNRNQPVNA